MKKASIIPLILLLSFGCSVVEEPEFEKESDILALMHIGTSNQEIIVDESYDIKDTLNTIESVDRAKSVVVYSDSDTFHFYRDDDWRTASQYETRARLNDTTLYSLEVVMYWGDTVTGEAYMPSDISISYPEDSQTISISEQAIDPITVVWNECNNTRYYMIVCKPDVDTSQYDSFPPFLFLPSIWGDTSYTFFLERMVLPWVYNMYYELTVFALSPEYTDYFGLEGPGSDMGNLSKGYGMFGGISADHIRVYIVP